MDNITKLKCRNCNGNHLTIKCSNKKKELHVYNTNTNNFNTNTNNFNTNPYIKYYKVKISELPIDITEKELYDLLHEWGTVVKIIIKYYEKTASAYVTFKNENEVDYLIKGLNSTVFDHNLIYVDKII